MSRRMIEMTQPDIAEILHRRGLVILPTGSVEQHGPHLPTGTDYFASVNIAEVVAEKLDGLVLPFCPIGVTPMHMPFEGTLTVSPETYQQLLVEVANSAKVHGAKDLLILNWHEGNIPSIAIAAERLHREYNYSVLVVQACYVAEEMFGADAGGLTHGGQIETWSVMCKTPELVHVERATTSSDRTTGRRIDYLRRTRTYQPVLRDVRVIAKTGWYGDPSKATPDDAARFLTTIGDAIASRAGEVFELLEDLNHV